MSLTEEARFIQALYSPQRDDGEIIGLQRSATELFDSLNEYRIRTNFNGYEENWLQSALYRDFTANLQGAFVSTEDEHLIGYTRYIDRTLKRKPKWFKRTEGNYNRNRERFDTLAAVADVPVDSNVYPFFQGFDFGTEDTRTAMARLAATETLLRLAYATRGKKGRQRFKRWLSKSYVILFSNKFGSGSSNY